MFTLIDRKEKAKRIKCVFSELVLSSATNLFDFLCYFLLQHPSNENRRLKFYRCLEQNSLWNLSRFIKCKIPSSLFLPSTKLFDCTFSIFELSLFRSVSATPISILIGSPTHSQILWPLVFMFLRWCQVAVFVFIPTTLQSFWIWVKLIIYFMVYYFSKTTLNPLVPGVNKKVTHT